MLIRIAARRITPQMKNGIRTKMKCAIGWAGGALGAADGSLWTSLMTVNSPVRFARDAVAENSMAGALAQTSMFLRGRLQTRLFRMRAALMFRAAERETRRGHPMALSEKIKNHINNA